MVEHLNFHLPNLEHSQNHHAVAGGYAVGMVDCSCYVALCLKSRIPRLDRSVQGAVATWSNDRSQKSLENIAC